MLALTRAALVSLIFFPACGGIAGPADAGSPDGGAVDAAAETADDAADEPFDASGFTQCSAPDGVQVCGVAGCPDDATCAGCLSQTGLSVCATKDPNVFQVPCQPCLDGNVCFQVYPDDPSTWISGPFSTGVLFAQNGGADRVRYCDMGTFMGDPLPAPPSCPSIAGVALCGGACGSCGTGERCVGRSPLHPYGFCVDGAAFGDCVKTSPSCSGLACFTFTVQSNAQALADEHGICVSPTLCQTLAASLPGGGSCTP